MAYVQKHLKRIIPTVLLIVGILLALWNFMHDNTVRITKQNEAYLDELTTQRAISVDRLFDENLSSIQATAYLYGKSLTSPWADVAVIREYEENTSFDRLRFIDASGDDYTSRGVMANLSDRAYFQSGMRGESAIVYVPASRVTGERQIGFYSPVYYENNIIGVMVGFYGEAYIRELLEYELFDYEGEGWLCDRDGNILGSTVTDEHENYFEYLKDVKRCSQEEVEAIRQAFASGADTAFHYTEDELTTTVYAAPLTQTSWLLLRNFPVSASQNILNNANREGMLLIAELVVLFAVYGVFMLSGMIVNQRRMREEGKNAKDISDGTSLLFKKFITVDLEEDGYHYIGGLPDDPNLPSKGAYHQFCASLLQRIQDDKQRTEAAKSIEREALMDALSQSDLFSLRVHAPIAGGEWFTYNFIVIERDGVQPKRLLVVSQDVTDMHSKEVMEQQRLSQALEDAERANRAKTEFLFNMSHDLRTPMNAIIGYTEIAQREDTTEEEMRGYIRKIDTSSEHLLALINDILEMSRIESGKFTLEPEVTDLTAVMREVSEMFQAQMSKKQIELSVRTIALQDAWVLCDRNRLNRVILNLVSNAYKFTSAGGHVGVILEETGKNGNEASFVLRVKDDGIGMSEEFVQRLFEPFERERTSTVSKTQGTGLGLSITKKIVDVMGGTVAVQTKKGEGTEFIVSLCFPVQSSPQKEPQIIEEQTISLDYSKIRLLLVEDNEINREIALMLLSSNGFMLDTAENGQIALEKVERAPANTYQCILMDIQMPVMDGYTAARNIRALSDPEKAKIPIIAMTANAFKEDIEEAKSAGMNAHIAKPLDVEKMMQTIQEVIAASL